MRTAWLGVSRITAAGGKRALSPALLIVLILIAPATLRTLAYASPPDPVWIHGIYDDDDFDNVVILITSGTAVAAPELSVDFEPAPLLVGRLAPAPETVILAISKSAIKPRAPPSLARLF